MLVKRDILIILKRANIAHKECKKRMYDYSKIIDNFVRNNDEVNEHIKNECAKTFFKDEARVDLYFKFIANQIPAVNIDSYERAKIDSYERAKILAGSIRDYLQDLGFVQYNGYGEQLQHICSPDYKFSEKTIFRKAHYEMSIQVWFHG